MEKNQQQENSALCVPLLTENEPGLEDFQCSTEVCDAPQNPCRLLHQPKESTELSVLEAGQGLTLCTRSSIGMTHSGDSF